MIANSAAAIVAFRPEPEALLALARQAKAQAALVFVFANSELDTDLAEALRAADVELIAAPINVGLGEAFNQLAEAAAGAGMRRLLLLDQDSEIPPGFIAALADAADALTARGEKPAVVGPRIVSPPGSNYKAPRYFSRGGIAPLKGAQAVHYVISSGSLVDLEALNEVGAFRADFFIDAIDTEWCFRAWSRGRSCWVENDVSMLHRIGQGTLRTLGAGVPRQPDFRLYAFARNQAHCLTLAHVPLAWKLRFFLHVGRVTLASWAARNYRLGFAAMMAQAFFRGLGGELGPPPGVENIAIAAGES